MIYLMKKFSFIFILYLLLAVGLVFPLFNYDRLTGPDPLTLNFVFTLAPYLFFVVLGAVYIHEQCTCVSDLRQQYGYSPRAKTE